MSEARTIQNLFDLTGKKALITGGSRGLGLQLAHALGEAGARLLISSRKAPELAEALAQFARKAASVFEQVDVVMTPTVPISAPLLADLADPAAYRHANMLTLRNTAFVNLFGWCALSLPTGLDHNHIPVGLQLIALPRQEAALLAMGMAVETAIGRAPELLGAPPRAARLM